MTNSQITTEEVIDELFDLYSDDIYRFALYSLKNSNDAKDVVQEVFLKAFQSWENFRGNSHPKTWLLQIARNFMYDQFRKRRVEAKFIENYSLSHELSNRPEASVTVMDLKHAIGKLQRNYRQVVTLRLIHDLSVDDTAQVLRWSAGKVRTTQHRALKQLKKLLSSSLNGFDSQERSDTGEI